jgi:hypothetical protein
MVIHPPAQTISKPPGSQRDCVPAIKSELPAENPYPVYLRHSQCARNVYREAYKAGP